MISIVSSSFFINPVIPESTLICMPPESLNERVAILKEQHKLSDEGIAFTRLAIMLIANRLFTDGFWLATDEADMVKEFVEANLNKLTFHFFKLEESEDEDKLYNIFFHTPIEEREELKKKRNAGVSHRLQQLFTDILSQGKGYAKSGEMDTEKDYRLITKLIASGFRFSFIDINHSELTQITDNDIHDILADLSNIEFDYLIDMVLSRIKSRFFDSSLDLPRMIPDKLENRVKNILGYSLSSLELNKLSEKSKSYLKETLLPWVGTGTLTDGYNKEMTVAIRCLMELELNSRLIPPDFFIPLLLKLTPAELAKPVIKQYIANESVFLTPLTSLLMSEALWKDQKWREERGYTFQAIIDFLIEKGDKTQFTVKANHKTPYNWANIYNLSESILSLVKKMDLEDFFIHRRIGLTDFDKYLALYRRHRNENKLEVVKAMIERIPAPVFLTIDGYGDCPLTRAEGLENNQIMELMWEKLLNTSTPPEPHVLPKWHYQREQQSNERNYRPHMYEYPFSKEMEKNIHKIREALQKRGLTKFIPIFDNQFIVPLSSNTI